VVAPEVADAALDSRPQRAQHSRSAEVGSTDANRLVAELRLLSAASQALQDSELARARKQLDNYHRRFPDGQLRSERDGLEVLYGCLTRAAGSDPAAEAWVNASLTVDGQTLAVGARYKGSVGAFLMLCTEATAPGMKRGPKVGRCSMKVAFDHADPNARFRGLRKLNLHAMGGDASLLRERLGYSLFREMGIAASRATHIRLVVNGVFQGVFLAVEEVDGRFTRARFEGGEGNLYKQVWPLHDDPNPCLKELESNRGAAADVTKMIRFKAALAANDGSSDRWLDMDYLMRWVAVDREIMNDDGAFHWYCYSQGYDGQGMPLPPLVRNHNFYWYEASARDRLWLVPWDLDNSCVIETTRIHITSEWTDTTSCQCTTFMGMSQRPAACDPLFARWRDLVARRSMRLSRVRSVLVA
jgi:spore coat protein CotH